MELTVVRIIRMHAQENEVVLFTLRCDYTSSRVSLISLTYVKSRIQMTVAITKDPNSSLKYFQEWQETINPGDDSHPNHHDCAILITKYLAIELTLRVSNLTSNELQRSFV